MSFGFGLDTARQLGFHFHRFAVGIGYEEYGGHPIRCFRLESLYLALAQTEPEEKAERYQLMQQHGVSELDAAFKVAEKIDRARGIESPALALP